MSLTKLRNTFDTKLFLLDCQRKGQHEVLEESLRPIVQIVCQDGELFVHHSVLISSSKVFQEHFVNLPSCAYKEILVIHVLDYQLDVIEPIIYSLYTGNCLVPKNKLNIVLEMFNNLKIDDTKLQWCTASGSDSDAKGNMRIRRFAETIIISPARISSSSTSSRQTTNSREVASASSSTSSRQTTNSHEVALASSSNSSLENQVPRKVPRHNLPQSSLKVLKRENGGIKIVDETEIDGPNLNTAEVETSQNVTSTSATTTTTNNNNSSERKRLARTDNCQVSRKISKSIKITPKGLSLTVAQVCESFRLVDVEIVMTNDINTYQEYRQYVFPLLKQKNPKFHVSTISRLISAKWKEYKTKLNSMRNEDTSIHDTTLNEETLNEQPANESSTFEQEGITGDAEATVLVNINKK